MARKGKPSVSLKGPANAHARESERIIEVSFADGRGGLIRLDTLDDGTHVIEPYRLDAGIRVRSSEASGENKPESMSERADALLVQWRNGNREHVISELEAMRPLDAARCVLMLAQTDEMDHWNRGMLGRMLDTRRGV